MSKQTALNRPIIFFLYQQTNHLDQSTCVYMIPTYRVPSTMSLLWCSIHVVYSILAYTENYISAANDLPQPHV